MKKNLAMALTSIAGLPSDWTIMQGREMALPALANDSVHIMGLTHALAFYEEGGTLYAFTVTPSTGALTRVDASAWTAEDFDREGAA